VTPPVVPAGLVGPSTSPTGAVTADVSMMALGDAYNSIALFMIQQNFKPPRTGPGVTCVVQFRIMRDGEIKNIKIYRSTGHADLDQSAQRALQETVRLPELYEFFKSDFIDVRVTFDFQKE
jgi:TonB family protein